MSYLGFPAMRAKCRSQQFSEGCFVFWGDTIFFYSNVPGVMLSTNAMFKSVLNIESSYRTSVEVLCAKMTQDRDLKGTSLLKLRQSRNSAL